MEVAGFVVGGGGFEGCVVGAMGGQWRKKRRIREGMSARKYVPELKVVIHPAVETDFAEVGRSQPLRVRSDGDGGSAGGGRGRGGRAAVGASAAFKVRAQAAIRGGGGGLVRPVSGGGGGLHVCISVSINFESIRDSEEADLLLIGAIMFSLKWWVS